MPNKSTSTGTPSQPSIDPSMRPGADPMPQAPGGRESTTIPGAGQVEMVPPGTDIKSTPGSDGKSRPVVIQPDIQESIGPGNPENREEEKQN